MTETFDFIVVGGGSAGAVIASRLTEDPNCRVALVEAGGKPPEVERMPAACAAMQLDPETDWMYTADPGGVGLGLKGQRMPVPRGRMLGGSSSLNYMAYVRGHPGDFDSWAENGADGWSYDEVLPYFRKSEALAPSGDLVIDDAAHGTDGPMGVSLRSPVLEGPREFVAAAEAAGIPRGDYNGRDRGGPTGVVSLLQTTTARGQRTSTYRAFLEGAEARPNLTIITHAQVTRIVLDDTTGEATATGVEYKNASGDLVRISAEREVVLSAGAVGSPHILMLSGVGPKAELERVGVDCVVDSPHVGKHLQDHIHVPLFFSAPGIGLKMSDVAVSMGPDALRAPAGPLPADPKDDVDLSPELQALKDEAVRRVEEWLTTGSSLISSSLYDAALWMSTGLGDPHSHDIQISFITSGYTAELFDTCLNTDPELFFDDVEARVGLEAESGFVLANPVLPHSEGEITLESADPEVHPKMMMNYLGDPHDRKVMVAALRKALDVIAHWPEERGIGPVMIPPHLATKHGHTAGESPSDALLEDLARHHSLTVYHHTSTCRIGDVVDPALHLKGVGRLRVADASVMPRVVSGNTNAAAIMIGEKAAELIAREHGIELAEFVG